MTPEELIAAFQNMQAQGQLRKDWSSPSDSVSGIAGYDLEAPAKMLVPVITPLRNLIPRVSGRGGVQANWRAVTAINTNNVNAGLQEGVRGGVPTTTVSPYSAAYVELGMEDFVTFKADLAAQNYQDVKALATQILLWNLMIGEELVILGGNSSYGMGTTPTPTAVGSISGGSLATATYSLICIALSFDAYRASTVAAGVPVTVARTNIDGTTTTYNAGAAQKSVAATPNVASGSAGSFTGVVTPVKGAVAYAWYWGASGSELLGAITTINSVLVTAAATGTQNASAHNAADHSQNAYVHDGLITMASKSAYGGYCVAQPNGSLGTGTPLTGGTDGSISEIDTDLRYFWDNLKLSPDTIWVGAQEQQNITKKVLSGSTTAAQRFNITIEQGAFAGGTLVTSYLNKFTMNGAQSIPIRLHPNMPNGTIMYTTGRLPYPLSNVGNVMQILTRRDYHQLDWPIRTRRWEYGVYTDQVLQHYFPPSLGLRQNIANG